MVEKYYDVIYVFCYRRFFGNRALAEDLTQDVFLKLIENIEGYQLTGKFFNYLFTIAVNTCNNYSSKKKLSTTELNEAVFAPEEDETVHKMMERETSDQIQKALNMLPDIQKEALLLKFFYNLKVKDIAQITKTSVPTAQSRVQQGLKKLNKYLDRKELFNE